MYARTLLYQRLKMSTNYLDNYGPLFANVYNSGGTAGLLITPSTIVGRHKKTREKDQPYECGMHPYRRCAPAFSVHFTWWP